MLPSQPATRDAPRGHGILHRGHPYAPSSDTHRSPTGTIPYVTVPGADASIYHVEGFTERETRSQDVFPDQGTGGLVETLYVGAVTGA